jgi:hypothetical protein
VALFDQLLVMAVLAGEAGSQLLEHDQLIAPVSGVRHALGLIHSHPQRLPAFRAVVDQSHVHLSEKAGR